MANKVKVYEITAVRLTRYRSEPPKLLIDVDGVVPTPGYTDPELIEYVYVHPPLDGIYELDFCAVPPSSPTTQVLTPITGKHLMNPMPRDLKGVKIYASNNYKVALLSDSKLPSAMCVKGKLTYEGVECQPCRSVDGELFTLIGDLNGFKNGDEVVVCGTIADVSICMQGTTLVVSWIGKETPRAR
jgi:hypothetical protein